MPHLIELTVNSRSPDTTGSLSPGACGSSCVGCSAGWSSAAWLVVVAGADPGPAVSAPSPPPPRARATVTTIKARIATSAVSSLCRTNQFFSLGPWAAGPVGAPPCWPGPGGGAGLPFSFTQKFHPGGAGPQAGSALILRGGTHPSGGLGQFGGLLYRTTIEHSSAHSTFPRPISQPQGARDIAC